MTKLDDYEQQRSIAIRLHESVEVTALDLPIIQNLMFEIHDLKRFIGVTLFYKFTLRTPEFAH